MADKTRSSSDRILTGAVWSAIGIVFILLIVVGYLFYQFEAKKSVTLVQREIKKAKKFEPSKTDGSLSHVVQGELYYRQGKVSAAISEFEKAIKKDPSQARALVNLGTVHAQERRYEEALSPLTEVIHLRKDAKYAHIDTFLAEAYYQRAVVKTAQGKCDKALSDAKAAIAITPMDADAHFALGHCYLTLKRYNEASKSFQTSVSFDPEFARALYELGQAEEKLGNTESAIGAYNRATSADPQLTEASIALQRLGGRGQ